MKWPRMLRLLVRSASLRATDISWEISYHISWEISLIILPQAKAGACCRVMLVYLFVLGARLLRLLWDWL
jgi:hypothetical protein